MASARREEMIMLPDQMCHINKPILCSQFTAFNKDAPAYSLI